MQYPGQFRSTRLRAPLDPRRSPHPTHSKRSDAIALVESAYRLDGSTQDWLDRIASMAAALIDQGLGVGATVRERASDGVHVRASTMTHCSANLAYAFAEFVAHGRPHTFEKAFLGYAHTPVELFSRILGGTAQLESEPASRFMYRCGVRDALAVRATDGRFQLSLNAWVPEPRRIPLRFRARWTRTAGHLASALKLRRSLADARKRLGSKYDGFVGCDAIASRTGNLEHVADSAKWARLALARAVVQLVHLRRGAATSDSDRALAVWSCLVSGRWSIVDHVDTGKRFIVARRNDPQLTPGAAMGLGETQVLSRRARGSSLKRIAHELGLSIATVSRTLWLGRGKLGIQSESELVGLFKGAKPSTWEGEAVYGKG